MLVEKKFYILWTFLSCFKMNTRRISRALSKCCLKWNTLYSSLLKKSLSIRKQGDRLPKIVLELLSIISSHRKTLIFLK